MNTFVFLGPSLPLSKAQAKLEAEYLPPVAMGDLFTLVESSAKPGDRIAMIDGFFEARPAVWHKEILHAIDRGVRVYGASSMGALRAAETHQFGMIGVGRIFESFRDGTLTDDDEVAVAHAEAEAGYRSLSDAMASLRFGLAEVVNDGAVEASLAEHLVRELKDLPYAQRSWATSLDLARSAGASDSTLEVIRNKAREPDAKARDAMALLDLLAAEQTSAEGTFKSDFTFQTTTFWTGLTGSMAMRVEEARNGIETSGDAAETADLAAFVRAGADYRDELLDRALLDRLSAEWSASHAPDVKERKAAVARIAKRNNLSSGSELSDWRKAQGLQNDAAWREAVDRECGRYWLRSQFMADLDRFIVARTKVDGSYARIASSREMARERIKASAIAKPSLQDFGLTPADLQQWYQQRFGPMLPDPTTHAQALGFETLGEFIERLLECFLAAEPDCETAPTPGARSPVPMENQL
ncbi:MAG: TfuA-like protein [Pseudomonadota bacterium]